MPTQTPPDMYARAQTLPLATDPLPNSGSQFYRPPGAPLRPTSLPAAAELPEDPAYSRRLVYCAALAGLLAGLVLGFGAAWLVAGWMWAQ